MSLSVIQACHSVHVTIVCPFLHSFLRLDSLLWGSAHPCNCYCGPGRQAGLKPGSTTSSLRDLPWVTSPLQAAAPLSGLPLQDSVRSYMQSA